MIAEGDSSRVHGGAVRVPEHRYVPRQLPARLPDFTGRSRDLAELDAHLSAVDRHGAVAVCVLNGMAGVGKTTLAVQWAHHRQDQFPSGTLFADLRGHGPGVPADPVRIRAGFLQALGIPEHQVPGEDEAQAGLYRSVLGDRKLLLVLDNARTPDQIRPLLPGSGESLVLVTSRAILGGLVVTDAAKPVTLGLLDAAAADRLFRSVVGDERVEAEPEATAKLTGLCAGLPLALRVVATRTAMRPHHDIADLVEELECMPPLDGFAAFADERSTLRTVFGWSYGCLDPAGARLFRLIGLHPGTEFSLDAAASVDGGRPAATRRVLDSLVDARMIEQVGRRRYRIHDLLHAYARELAEAGDSGEERDIAQRRLLTWYAVTAQVADRLVFAAEGPFTVPSLPVTTRLADRSEAVAWLTAEQTNLAAALHLSMQTEFHAAAVAVAVAARFLSLLGKAHHGARLEAETLGLTAARRADDRSSEALLHARRGDTNQLLERYEDADADHRRELALGDELGSSVRRMGALSGLARGRLLRGRYDEAELLYRQALPLARGIDSGRSEAVIRGNLSRICSRLGRFREALDEAGRELDLRRAASDSSGEAMALCDNAIAWQAAGDDHQAAALSREAITRYRNIGNTGKTIATPLITLATSLERLGEREEARRALREAEMVCAEFGDPRAEELESRLRRLER